MMKLEVIMKNTKVLLLAALLIVMAFAIAPVSAAPKDIYSIVDLVVANPDVDDDGEGDFDTLLALVSMFPDIVATLDGKGQFTVFAPTDDAFADLFAVVDPSTLTADQVKDILLYHVARGNRDAADVTTSSQIRMLNGEFAMVNGASIDGQAIIGVDNFVDNGVVHIVDGVLLP
jgi:uncharacterized surface protein with fasciclin (FAS1) repeats